MKFSRQFIAYLSILLCGLSTMLVAVSHSNSPQTEEESSPCENIITAGADWLYWKVNENGLSLFALETGQPTDAETIDVLNFGSEHPHFNYENGVRGYLKCRLPGCSWDLLASFTYLPVNAKTSVATPTGEIQSNFITNFTGSPILISVSLPDSTGGTSTSNWHSDINWLDIDLGRNVCFSDCLKLRPHIGFRAAWMKQTLNRKATLLSETTTLEIHSQFEEKFTGYGVEGGLWGEWHLPYGLSIIGHVGGSILYSKFQLNTSFFQNNILPDVSISSNSSHSDQLHVGTPTVDYFAGLHYTRDFCNISLSATVGWEWHEIFQVNKFATSKENLSLGGLTLGCNMGF